MGPRQSYKFLQDNREAFLKLTDILREADTVRPNAYDKYTPETRRLAIELVERWIQDLFNFSDEGRVELPKTEEKGIYLIREEEIYS